METLKTLKILFLAANPIDQPDRRIDEEIRAIDEVLQGSKQRDQFVLQKCLATRPKDIQRALLEDPVPELIIHYCGYGAGKEGLMFQDNSGKAKLASVKALADLFKLFENQIKCVVLNGCHTGNQAKAIAEHISCVIGMPQVLANGAAIAFSGGFYGALGAGRPFDFAYEIACNAIDLEQTSTESKPVLLQKANLFENEVLEEAVEELENLTLPSLESPYGPVPSESFFYVKRPPIEAGCLEFIREPGAVLRLTAPDKMGKTSMMTRILDCMTQEDYKTAYFNLNGVEQENLTDLSRFLRLFCRRVTSQLRLENQLNKYWDESLGPVSNCTEYFEEYILPEANQQLVLGLDDVDRLFDYPVVASNFFGMLRSWIDNKGKRETPWKRLRLVLAYSTEDFGQIDIYQSPFNVGKAHALPWLTQEQAQALAKLHGLNWTKNRMQGLWDMVGGHPYLLRLAMYSISRQEVTLEDVLNKADTESGIYGDHLDHYWRILQKDSQLKTTVRAVMTSKDPVKVERSQRYALHRMGLINQLDNPVSPSCKLYRLFFTKQLGS